MPTLPTAPPQLFHNRSLPRIESEEAISGSMSALIRVLELAPSDAPEFIDLTSRIEAFVTESGIRGGQLMIHSLHTTAAVVINEREPLLLEDAAEFLDRLAPRESYYRHDDLSVRTVNMMPDEPANAHSHLQHLMLGGTKMVPVGGGRMVLGQWQRIFLVELDGARPRKVMLQLTGVV